MDNVSLKQEKKSHQVRRWGIIFGEAEKICFDRKSNMSRAERSTGS